MAKSPLIWLNDDGLVLQWRNDDPADINFVVNGPAPPPTPGAPATVDYDILAALDMLFPGIVVQQPLVDAAWNRWAAKGSPLDSGDVTGILAAANALNAATSLADYVPTTEPNYPTTLPPYPTGLPRFPDAYGGMQAPDGWSIVDGGQVVRG